MLVIAAFQSNDFQPVNDAEKIRRERGRKNGWSRMKGRGERNELD